MPRRIVTLDGKTYRWVEYELPPLGPLDVRLQVTFAAPKHGTEGQLLTGGFGASKVWNKELRLFLPTPVEDVPAAPAPPTERGLGNIVVGVVTEVGADVTQTKVGEHVFTYGQIREVVQVPEDKILPLGNLSPEDAVCTDPAHVAFVAVRDGNIRVGDDVAVYGLGAIGLMAVQIARAGGAARVFAVDPLPARRDVAVSLGADAAFDPRGEDAALAIKMATGKQGIDVALETSGNAAALHDAIRAIRQCGTVVHVPWGPKECAALHLNEEFHLNRPTLVGSQAWEGWGNPDRDYPLWTHARAYAASVDLFRRGLVTGHGIVTPIVGMDDAPDALATILTAPDKSIKVGVRLGE